MKKVEGQVLIEEWGDALDAEEEGGDGARNLSVEDGRIVQRRGWIPGSIQGGLHPRLQEGAVYRLIHQI